MTTILSNLIFLYIFFFTFSILRIFIPGELVMWTCDICTLSCGSPWDSVQVPKRVCDGSFSASKATDESLLNVCTSHPCYLNNALLGKQSWDTFFDRCDWFRDWKAEAKAETTEMHRSQLQTSWLLREILSVGAGAEFPWEKSEMNR